MSAVLTSNYLELPDGKIHYKSGGEDSNETIVFLHGFPEFWYSWRKQLDYFSKDYQVIAPDLRGYNKSLKPKRVNDYKINKIATDVVDLIKHLGKEKVIVVGHDWGAAIAWHLALLYEERFSKVIILNVPHPFVFRSNLYTNPKQTVKSWYMFFFQIPFLPYRVLSRNNFQRGIKMLSESSNPGSFTADDLQRYKAAWANEGAMRYMIMWYKSAFRHQSQMKDYKDKKVAIPLKIIWGKQDFALEAKMAQESLAYCEQGDLTYIEEATHWVNQDCPQEVNQLIEAFLLEK